jgi:hypothetical protein
MTASRSCSLTVVGIGLGKTPEIGVFYRSQKSRVSARNSCFTVLPFTGPTRENGNPVISLWQELNSLATPAPL